MAMRRPRSSGKTAFGFNPAPGAWARWREPGMRCHWLKLPPSQCIGNCFGGVSLALNMRFFFKRLAPLHASPSPQDDIVVQLASALSGGLPADAMELAEKTNVVWALTTCMSSSSFQLERDQG